MEEQEQQVERNGDDALGKDQPLNFRRRRLSLPRHHLEAANAAALVAKAEDDKAEEPETRNKEECEKDCLSNGDVVTPQTTSEQPHGEDDDMDEKAHTFRKRRLSLTFNRMPNLEEDPSNNEDDDADGPDPKRQRRLSTAESSVASNTSASPSLNNNNNNNNSKARIMHSAEMISGPFAPPSPIHHNHVLHKQNPLPPSQSSALDDDAADTVHSTHLESHLLEFSPRRLRTRSRRRYSWKQRHHHSDEEMLPFPKHVVGTYSCHGIEPIYDESDYEQSPPPNEQPSITTGDKLSRDNESFWGDYQDSAESFDNEAKINGTQKEQQTSISAKINQDRGGITYPYANSDKTALFAVYDGHGQGGELVSQFALHEIQRRLEKHPLFSTNLEAAMRETFLTVDEALKHEPIIEPFFAGTTACLALLQDKKITLANAGDSRAVLGRKREDNGDWEGIDLTNDQNPDSPLEMERILNLGGFVSPPPGPGLSARVWLDAEMTQIGLAMARSIGDHAVSDVGVIADPVVSTHTVNERDEFMILASDGVWEFLESQEAVQIVGDHLEELGATKACQALIEAAASKWHEEEGEYRDDITAIVVQLHHLWSGQPSKSQKRQQTESN